MSIIDESLAIAEKEIKLSTRFKLPFFTQSLVGPLIRILPFLLIYTGFFSISQDVTIGELVKPDTFIVFLILGMLADVFFETGWRTFGNKFMREKFWETISATFLAPINKLSLILGTGLAEFVSIFPSLIIFFIIGFIIVPIGFLKLGVILLALLLLFLISLSIGLIVGSASLFNENFIPIFNYVRIVIVFFSCFYYPIEVLEIKQLGAIGQIFPAIASINPVYQVINLIRNIWFGTGLELQPLIYILFFAIVTPIAAVYLFKRLFKVLSIQGY